jgi:plasmid stability protein
MANLQVRDIDDRLYESIRVMASSEKRSISQEVVHILENYLSRPDSNKPNPTDEFLQLAGSWEDNRDSDTIIKEMKAGRKNSTRFGHTDELFD